MLGPTSPRKQRGRGGDVGGSRRWVCYDDFMVRLIGPAMSLSASGDFGKTIFYYDTKAGARLRIKYCLLTKCSFLGVELVLRYGYYNT